MKQGILDLNRIEEIKENSFKYIKLICLKPCSVGSGKNKQFIFIKNSPGALKEIKNNLNNSKYFYFGSKETGESITIKSYKLINDLNEIDVIN